MHERETLSRLILINLHKKYGNTGYGVSSLGIQIQKDVCLKINIPKGNYYILRNDVMGRCQNLTFKFNFLCQKSSESFSLKNTNLGAHYLLLTFFDNINFQITLFSKNDAQFLPNNMTNPVEKCEWILQRLQCKILEIQISVETHLKLQITNTHLPP